jgi:hypothetical protein
MRRMRRTARGDQVNRVQGETLRGALVGIPKPRPAPDAIERVAAGKRRREVLAESCRGALEERLKGALVRIGREAPALAGTPREVLGEMQGRAQGLRPTI